MVVVIHALRTMEICPCSPDTGDCLKCKKACGVDKMSCSAPMMGGSKLSPDDLPDGGRRRRSKKWIQGVVSHMKEGAFTQQALKHHMTPEAFASEVKKHPKKYTLKTRRRAQFLRNIRKTRKSSHSKK